MVALYLEASALVKLLIEEAGSHDVRRVAEASETLVTSAISVAEVGAALAAAKGARRISPSAHRVASRAMERLLDQLHIIEAVEPLCAAAAALASLHDLSGCDAIHLASASVAPRGTVFATWDARLSRAASREGFATVGSA